MLRAVTLPAYGGTTTWASTEAAYDSVARTAASALADNLWAVHTNDYDYAAQSAAAIELTRGGASVSREFVSDYYETEHPVVAFTPRRAARAAPRPFRQTFRRAGSAGVQRLFNLLQARITKLENTIRWNWQPGDLAIWDNRATQHYAVADYDDQYRHLNRVTSAGDIPVDINGTPSRAVVGDASQYSDVVNPVPLAS